MTKLVASGARSPKGDPDWRGTRDGFAGTGAASRMAAIKI
jgi:hypothetical protein